MQRVCPAAVKTGKHDSKKMGNPEHNGTFLQTHPDPHQENPQEYRFRDSDSNCVEIEFERSNRTFEKDTVSAFALTPDWMRFEAANANVVEICRWKQILPGKPDRSPPVRRSSIES
jgi:hypothetical protein